MSKCPQCNEVLKEGVKFCTKCGYEIAKEKVKKFFCPYCGYENIQGARICTWCEKEIATSNIIKEEEVNLFNGDGLAYINFEDFERQAIDSLAEKHQFTYSVLYLKVFILQKYLNVLMNLKECFLKTVLQTVQLH